MASLSNFFRPRDPLGTGEVTCRRIQRPEIESALRLILMDDNGPAGDEAVLDFLAFAMQRKIDVNQIWVAVIGSRIVWALLPIPSPGRTMLLFTPNYLPHTTSPDAAQQLVHDVCSYWAEQDMHLAQFLIDPQRHEICKLYESMGFERLAELIYLSKSVKQPLDIVLPTGMEIVHYDQATHPLFAQTILRSYEQSLDCPALNGRRNIEDVIAGHKAAGLFDPAVWNLLVQHHDPLAVLILGPSQNHDSVELVYLGLAPEARGRGIGDLLMKLAMKTVADLGRSELSLAVDSRNTPALRLYFRHGMHRVGTRVALLRDLRAGAAKLPVGSHP